MFGGPINYGNPVSSHPLNRGLGAWWLGLPQWSGGTRLIDLTLSRRAGTLTNGPTWAPRPGGFQSVKFDGSDDFVDGPTLTPFATGTIYSHVSFSSVSASYKAFFIGLAGANDWHWWIGIESGAWGAGISNGASFAGFTGSGTPVAGQWYTLALTNDGTTARLYLDGVQIGSTGTTGVNPSEGKVYLGQNGGGVQRFPGSGLAWGVYPGRVLPAIDLLALHSQIKRGYPDLLNRISPRVYSFAPDSGGAAVVAKTGASVRQVPGGMMGVRCG